MSPVNSNSGIDSPTPGQPQLEEASTAVSAGREVSVYIQNQSPFLCLPYETKSMIIRYLGFREITRLVKVCRHLRDLVEHDKALERAWYRRFPSPHQYQLKAMITKKDEQQLRDWLAPFADEDTVESLLKQRESTYFPAQLLFTNSKLMSQCKKFKLAEKARIPLADGINTATFSAISRRVVVASVDHKLKIYGQENGGTWEEKNTIAHNGAVMSACFSSDGRHVLAAGYDKTVTIYSQADNGSWEETASIPHVLNVRSFTFTADGRRLMTFGPDHTVKFFGQGDNGSWELKDIIYHTSPVISARFSVDESLLAIHDINSVVTIYGKGAAGSWAEKATLQGTQKSIKDISADNCHLLTRTGFEINIFNLQADGSWKKAATISHNFAPISATFSADSCHVVSASRYFKAKIYSRRADSSWQEKACITHNDELFSATFSADCLHVATTSSDKTAKIHGLQANGSWREEANIGHKSSVISATFSADGCHVITTSVDGTAKIYGQEADGSWLEKATIRHERGVTLAKFSPDDRYVMTLGVDCSARITELRKDDDDRMSTTQHLPEAGCLLS
ncbi:F-box/WD40 repeat-containing protein [Endozoicomonas sp. 8E]|uniref:F-box/WD40 repeat-containing protein n=1 Tax=Endozoicomonas sp. 8E TaxID=3035692 RepID=UPI00293907C3|nr:F-box/WD40 repeat-containing protein [Endozoicomonas sp. 8E]WOG28272.1 F-box/WD40 repeat-containing protein [Endozoicomonas sp. 8E]